MKAEITKAPVAETEMLIRKPVADVFEAFIDPDITTNFWFTKSSGRLKVGHEIRWDWEMYGASTLVLVKAIEPDKRILIEWDGYSGRTTVEWKFSAREDATTYVVITESGWTGNGDELVKYVGDSTQGFTWTLAGLKAFLEHGIRLNLVADKNPDAHKDAYRTTTARPFSARPFLMFQGGSAQAALDLYFATFPDSRMVRVERRAQGEPGAAGTIKVAVFTICGREFMCSDSPVKHDFSFTPSSSTFVEFDSAAELERVFGVLSEGGQVLMPLDDYGFSQRFGWVNDRFGVSWQLNLAKKRA